MPAASLGLGALLAGSIGGVALNVLGSFAASLVLGGVSRALAPKPKQSSGISWAGRTVTVRQSANPRQEIVGRARVGGTYAWMHARDSLGGDQWLHMAIVFAGHECDAIEEVWFDDYLLALDADGWERGRYNVLPSTNGDPAGSSYVRVRKYLGAPGQVADPILMQYSDGKWTGDHRLAGCTYLAILLTSNPDLFPNGIPQISVVARGRKLFDDRTGLTTWSDNPALALARVLRTELGATVNGASVIAAANACDESVPLAAGGWERRYTANGAYALDQAPKEIITDLANAMAGYALRSGSEWLLEAGAYTAPAIALTDDDLRAPDRVRTRISRRENFNSVRGVFSSPENHWQPDDFPPVRSATYLAEDEGREAWKDIELPFTTSASLAQRLAKIDLLRARQQITVEMPCKLSALRVRAGSVVSVTSSFYGWSGKAFRVNAVSLVTEEVDGAPALGVNLSLREIASNVYDWSASEEQAYDVAPDTNLPDPWSIAAPGVPAITEEMYETTGSAGVRVRAVVTWGPSLSAFADGYEHEYRLASSATWVSRGRTGALQDVIDDIPPGLHEFRVRALSQRGVRSAWATRTQEIFGLSARPADVTGLSVQAISALALLRWARHADLDVRIGGRIHVRHSLALTGATWSESYAVTEPVPGDSTLALVPYSAGTYLVRAEDSSGNLAANPTAVVAGNASILAFTTVGTPVQEDPTFGGAKSGVIVDTSKLQLSGSVLWDDLGANFDTAAANLDAAGGIALAGTYTFATGIDVGSVKNVRLVSTLQVETVQVTSLFDSRAGLIDDWQSWDGDDRGGIGEVVLEYRQTDDNPGGTPTWSPWRRLSLIADATARGFQFRAQLSVSDPSYNIRIVQLRVTAQEAL